MKFIRIHNIVINTDHIIRAVMEGPKGATPTLTLTMTQDGIQMNLEGDTAKKIWNLIVCDATPVDSPK